GQAGGPDHLRVIDLARAARDVVPYGAGQQDTFLRNVADRGGELAARELDDVGAVDQNPPGLRPIEALDDLQQRALAAAVAADERVDSAGRQPQGDAAKHRRGGRVVGEGDVLDGDLAARP